MASRNEIINNSQITLNGVHTGPEGIVVSIDLGATHSNCIVFCVRIILSRV